MDWQQRLWQELVPHLPHGRVGLWAPLACQPAAFACPDHLLPHWHDLLAPAPPHGSALQGLVILGCGQPALGWTEFLTQLSPLLAPQAPLLVLVPRRGLVQLPALTWQSPYGHRAWQKILLQAGWRISAQHFLGGTAWPSPWASAACRLYTCSPQGTIPPRRVQFNSSRTGVAAASGC